MMDINDLLKDNKGNNFIDMNNNSEWIKFFFIFSRFEYALKRTGYIFPRKKYAEADWKTFGEKMGNEFNKQKCQELTESIKYLEEKPPKRQVVKDGRLDWADLDYRNYKDKEILRLICAIKQVRNNLFHGGKYPLPAGPVEDPSRDSQLMKNSIIILKHLLNSSKEVKEKYDESLE